jgi:hypothetical protein
MTFLASLGIVVWGQDKDFLVAECLLRPDARVLPGIQLHQALDALATAIIRTPVNWMLD